MPYTGTPRTWVASEMVTAALLNSDVRDPLTALSAVWSSYTPTIAQGATSNIAKSVTTAAYIQFGKLIIGSFVMTASAAGTAGSVITVSLPVAAAVSSNLMVGFGGYSDVSASPSLIAAGMQLISSTTIRYIRTDAPPSNAVGLDPALTVASGDILNGTFMYQAA